MKTGRLSESVSFDDKERAVLSTVTKWFANRLIRIKESEPEEYQRYIEERYKSHTAYTQAIYEYIEKHATRVQLDELEQHRGTPKYETKAFKLYLGLIENGD